MAVVKSPKNIKNKPKWRIKRTKLILTKLTSNIRIKNKNLLFKNYIQSLHRIKTRRSKRVVKYLNPGDISKNTIINRKEIDNVKWKNLQQFKKLKARLIVFHI